MPLSYVQYCVAVGTPWDGLTLFGPFPTHDAATQWAEALDAGWEVVPLESPAQKEED